MTQEFNNDIIFWLKMGYGILRINYRGSLGKFILNIGHEVSSSGIGILLA